MNEVWLVHTVNADLTENDIKVFTSKSLAQIFAWNYYMKYCFYPDDVEDDWQSLMLDNQIYSETESGLNVKAIWITYHKIVEGIEPKITLTIDPFDKKK